MMFHLADHLDTSKVDGNEVLNGVKIMDVILPLSCMKY